MFTVCPKCTLTLAVTATDLRLGQGYVRCGRCSNVFNALLRLTEALGDADAASAAPPQADPASTAQIRQALSSAALSASSRPAITPKPPPASRPAATPAPTTARSAARPATAPTPAAPPPAAVSAAGAVSARRETDFDAIGQFEQVLQTLGISLLEEEPVPPSSALPPPVAAMDELDAMTRRLAAATGEAADTNTDTDTDTDTDRDRKTDRTDRSAASVGHIDVNLDCRLNRLIVEVRDDGAGLPDRFDIDLTQSLGLSIVRDLVRSQLGGTITMSNQGQGRSGTVVVLDVPMEHPQPVR